MKNKVLIAVDESQGALKAVEYAARTLGKDARITLFNVFFKLPPEQAGEDQEMGRHHHELYKERIKYLRQWFADQRALIEKAMEKAKGILTDAGIDSGNIQVEIQERKKGVARDILDELERGQYDTLVVGRRGLSAVKEFFLGSISSKIVQHARKCAVWVVE